MRSYDHRKIEKKWQQKWAKVKQYQTRDSVKGKRNFFLLTEFPYPSGNLHVGHWYAFSIPDILARTMRMLGKNVLYPIGFDAFGLPAENAAIRNKLNPRKWTYGNIEYMKKQMAAMGTSFDWSREVITSDPSYYKWTQWQFLQFFKNGLAYKKETPVNWCPKDKTVLANEQVINGRCERCDSEVVQRNMLQWKLKITQYADRLVDDLQELDWPEQIKESQRNWIGRSEGAEIDFPLEFGRKDGPKPNYLVLHGWYKSSSKGACIPWLKKSLEEKGFRVQAPDLPNPEKPTEDEQVNSILKTCMIDERTIIVGHSLGGTVAMKLLEKINRPIAGLVLVAPAMNPFVKGAKRRPFWNTFNWDIDYDRIRRLAPYRVVLSDLQEGEPRVPYLREVAVKAGATLVEGNAHERHFFGAKEPMVLHSLLPHLAVFTTRADTLFGATYLVLAPEHPWVTLALDDRHTHVLSNAEEVRSYVQQASKKTELERLTEQKEKTGVELKGVKAVNPATGKNIPLCVADYVLAHYGTGAIMAVPAHDLRDHEFAKKFGLPIRDVIISDNSNSGVYAGDGVLVNSGIYSGSLSGEARGMMTEAFGQKKTTYKLRDWIVSRQRYWGVPIPIIHCKDCGDVAVPDKELPVKLPEVKDYLPEGTGRSPLAKATKWVKVKCPKCKKWAQRETDTFDTFVDSSWYFLRYADPKNKKSFASAAKMRNWMPVNLYSGGADHTTMHLLYSRFWQKALYDLGLVKDKEPYTRRMNRSIILGPDGQKMSKSRGNVIDPDEVVARLGADTVRMYLAFIGPYNEVSSYPWNPDSVAGVRRFLERVWRMGQAGVESKVSGNANVETLLHKTVKKVGEDIQALKFNTAIAALMSFLNVAEKEGMTKVQYSSLLRLLAPFAPHITEELWLTLGNTTSIHLQSWPRYDEKQLREHTVTIAVQINGKTRTTILVEHDSDEAHVRAEAEKNSAIIKHLAGLHVNRVVYVKNRLLNFVA